MPLPPNDQKRILYANSRAFEELARQWRNADTGEAPFDLKDAVLGMVREYFSAPSYGKTDLYLDQAISYLQAELDSVDADIDRLGERMGFVRRRPELN